MNAFPLAAILLTFAAPAFAQSQLERLETATAAAGANMEAFITSAVPELAPVMPDWSWDADMRAAAACTLDAIRAEAGDAAVDAYVAEMEVFATVQVSSIEQIGTATPVPINPTFAMEVGQSCGTAEIAMRRMQASGLMQAMMDPAVMGRLMGQ